MILSFFNINNLSYKYLYYLLNNKIDFKYIKILNNLSIIFDNNSKYINFNI